MLVRRFPARSFSTNCYVVAPSEGRESSSSTRSGRRRRDRGPTARAPAQPVGRRAPTAHDHMRSASPSAAPRRAPYVHPADRDLLSHPGKSLALGVGGAAVRRAWCSPSPTTWSSCRRPGRQAAGHRFQSTSRPGTPPVRSCSARPGRRPGERRGPPSLRRRRTVRRVDRPLRPARGDLARCGDRWPRSCCRSPTRPSCSPATGPDHIGEERATNPYLQDLRPPRGPGL